jgi:hypothetical protein
MEPAMFGCKAQNSTAFVAISSLCRANAQQKNPVIHPAKELNNSTVDCQGAQNHPRKVETAEHIA